MLHTSIKHIENPDDFPCVSLALDDPDGLLGFGNKLSTELVIAAYNKGIFPWFSGEQPVLWWSPSKRAILFPQNIKIRKSLRQSINNRGYKITLNSAFHKVINLCSSVYRKDQEDTWITDEMIEVYSALHQMGHAHSIEAWSNSELIGGLYGIYSNGLFCGESMFSIKTDASKICLVALSQFAQQLGIKVIDCQIMNPHLQSLGAKELTRNSFLNLFNHNNLKLNSADSANLEIRL